MPLDQLGLIFPGQGTHVEGMQIGGLLEQHPEIARNILDRADAIFTVGDGLVGRAGTEKAGIALNTFSDALLFATAGDLAQTRLNQPAITVHGAIVVDCLRKLYPGLDFQGTIGNSVGQYAAMYAAGVLTLEDTFRAIGARANAMQDAVDTYTRAGVRGCMKVVMGLDITRLEEIVRSLSDSCSIGTTLGPDMATLSGTEAQVERAVTALKEVGVKKIINLPTGGGAYHSALMESALDPMRTALADIQLRDGLPVYENVSGKPVSTTQMMDALIAQITNVVRLREGLQAMEADGFTRVLGISAKPGEAAKYVGMNTGMQSHNVATAADLEGSTIRDFLGVGSQVQVPASYGAGSVPAELSAPAVHTSRAEREVVITGLGFVGPTGLREDANGAKSMSVANAWENAKAGISGIRRIEPADLRLDELGIKSFDALSGLGRTKLNNALRDKKLPGYESFATLDQVPPELQSQLAFELLFPSRVAGLVDASYVRSLFGSNIKKKNPDDYIYFALLASQQALAQAGLISAGMLPGALRERAGVSFGSGIGGIMSIETGMMDGILRGSDKVLGPNFMPGMLANMSAGWIANTIGAQGPSTAPNGACASAGQAIEDGFRYIKDGDLDVSIVGGAEAAARSVIAVRAFGQVALATGWENDPTRASRPFDVDRNGFVIAEGAGALVLEEARHADKRGTKHLARIAGVGGSTCLSILEGSGITSGTSAGQTLSVRNALQKAGLRPDQIDWSKLHGTSTLFGDKMEGNVVANLFGRDHQAISLKSMIAHGLGASFAQEIVLMVCALLDGAIPPTINCDNLDPAVGLQNVVRELRRGDFRRAMGNTFGFGGVNRTLILERA